MADYRFGPASGRGIAILPVGPSLHEMNASTRYPSAQAKKPLGLVNLH